MKPQDRPWWEICVEAILTLVGAVFFLALIGSVARWLSQ